MWEDAPAYAAHLTSFGAPAVAQFLAREDTAMWLAESEAGAVGFLSLVMNSPDPVEARRDGAEIPRIYLLSSARGRALGASLLAEAERHATALGANHLWLDVMKAAPWARRTYASWGFEEFGETQFPGNMTSAFRPMVVMRRACIGQCAGDRSP